MVLRALCSLIAFALCACGQADIPVAAAEVRPAPSTSPAPVIFPETVAETVSNVAATDADSALAPTTKSTPNSSSVVEPLIDAAAIDLIVSFEVGSPELYEQRYTHPIWPGAASGPTWGIGYDGGHRDASAILVDWEAHPHAARLASASGITGPIAREWVRVAADISVEWGLARVVFDQTSLVEHYRIARRVFGAPFDRAPGAVRGSLTSLVFNRGGSMRGDGRREMRIIRDECLPAGDWNCVAAELRGMTRIWRGSSIEGGMKRRREAEARLAESAT